MNVRRLLIAPTVLAVLTAGSIPVWAQEQGEARLGGGSDIAENTVVRLIQGGSIPPIHVIFADNPQDEPIEVEFRVDAPTGISVQPEWETKEVPAGGIVENHFGVEVGSTVAPGEYRVVVQLVRSDIEPEPGVVTAIPAIQTAFTVEVTGEGAAVTVRAVSALTGAPVAGTIVLTARDGERWFQVDRAEGATLEARVAPGEYRAAFLLADRELTATEFTVDADDEIEVVLEVATVSFVLVAAKPREENGRVVVADLVAGVNNETDPMTGPVVLRANVFHDDIQVDTVIVDEISELPGGISEAAVTYRPEDGWQQGTYRFAFQLVTPEFTLAATDEPVIDIPGFMRFDFLVPFAALDVREWVALVAVAILALVFIAWLVRLVMVRRRRRVEDKAPPQAPDVDRSTRRRRWWRRRNRHSVPQESWLDERIGPTTDHRAAWNDDDRVVSHPVDPPTPPPAPSPREPGSTAGGSGAQTPVQDPVPQKVPPPLSFTPQSATRGNDGGDMGNLVDALRVVQQLHDRGHLSASWSITDATLVYWAMSSSHIREALDSVGMTEQEYVTAMKRLFAQGLLGNDSRIE